MRVVGRAANRLFAADATTGWDVMEDIFVGTEASLTEYQNRRDTLMSLLDASSQNLKGGS